MNEYPRDQAKVSVHCRWPLIRGNLTLKCVGRGIDNVAAHDEGRPRQVLLYIYRLLYEQISFIGIIYPFQMLSYNEHISLAK